MATRTALAHLHPLLEAVWKKTAKEPEEMVTTARLAALKAAMGDHVRVRVVTARAAGPQWRLAKPMPNFAGGYVAEVFLQCHRRPHAQVPPWAREANGVVLGLGATAAAPWEYLAIPPPAVRYVARIEELPEEGEVFRAEDGSRVTVTAAARQADGVRYSTAGAPDASNVCWFGGAKLPEVLARYAPTGLAATLEPGRSYTFLLHDAEFQPFEQESAGLWFLCSADLASREVSYDPPEGCGGRERLDVPLASALEAVRRGEKEAGQGGRPFYGIAIEAPGGSYFVESRLYRNLRTMLYESDPMDREVGPECRLNMRGIRAFLHGAQLQAAFESYFPSLAVGLFGTAQAVVTVASVHMVRLVGEQNGRAAKGTLAAEVARVTGVASGESGEAGASGAEAGAGGASAAASAQQAGKALGEYMLKVLKDRPEVLARIHPAAPNSYAAAQQYLQQPAHLDVLARMMFPELEQVPGGVVL